MGKSRPVILFFFLCWLVKNQVPVVLAPRKEHHHQNKCSVCGAHLEPFRVRIAEAKMSDIYNRAENVIGLLPPVMVKEQVLFRCLKIYDFSLFILFVNFLLEESLAQDCEHV